MAVGWRVLGSMVFAGWLGSGPAWGMETCLTQSKMQPAEREMLAGAARSLAEKIRTNDQAGLRAATIPEFQKDFSGIANLVTTTSPKLKGSTAEVEQVYLLDASKPDASATSKPSGGAATDAQFYCTLNGSQAEADFTIPELPQGRYGFAMVRMEAPSPWRMSLLLRQDGGQWALAGLYPKPLTASGHDGLWYWKEARGMQARRERWNAWLYFQEAQNLLTPANFVSSTHLEKLRTELTGAAPPAISGGMSGEAPLVVKGPDETEYRFTSITVDDSLGKEKLDIAAHLKVAQLADAASARKRNIDAMRALVKLYPEVRKAFHGVWIFTEAPGQSPYATEQAMEEIR